MLITFPNYQVSYCEKLEIPENSWDSFNMIGCKGMKDRWGDFNIQTHSLRGVNNFIENKTGAPYCFNGKHAQFHQLLTNHLSDI